MARTLTFIVVGATGDLARRKLFPALFACFARGYLPDEVRFVGAARTDLDDHAFRQRLAEGLKCDDLNAETCSLRAGDFLKRCHYQRCEYGSAADFSACASRLPEIEGPARANRVIYLAVPPFVFPQAIGAMSQAGVLTPGQSEPWTRLVVEKPFGRDRASYDELQRVMSGICDEKQTYRIDHYLGKEVVQNLLVLRFANTVFEPLWSSAHLHHVHIAWSERQGVAGRAGYFDRYGIIRDVMQNHLLQILALVAMEKPEGLRTRHIQDAKVAVLRQMPTLSVEDLVVGQYGHAADGGERGYREEEGVPSDSITPTYAAAVLHVNTPRWRRVPFLITAGKGLQRSLTEVRLHYRPLEGALLSLPEDRRHPGYAANELVIQVQPDERIVLRIVNKVPGVGMTVGTTELNLSYRESYPGMRIADAYENLLLDVVNGERGLFIRGDELEAAWDIFTPALHALEQRRQQPESYAIGGAGPSGLDALAARYGILDARIFEREETASRALSVVPARAASMGFNGETEDA